MYKDDERAKQSSPAGNPTVLSFLQQEVKILDMPGTDCLSEKKITF